MVLVQMGSQFTRSLEASTTKGEKKVNNLRVAVATVILGFLFATNGHSQSAIDNMSACLTLEDMTKDRLDCYDALVPPTPKKKPGVAKMVNDCKFIGEQDQRLGCFNRFLVAPGPRVIPSVAPKRIPRT